MANISILIRFWYFIDTNVCVFVCTGVLYCVLIINVSFLRCSYASVPSCWVCVCVCVCVFRSNGRGFSSDCVNKCGLVHHTHTHTLSFSAVSSRLLGSSWDSSLTFDPCTHHCLITQCCVCMRWDGIPEQCEHFIIIIKTQSVAAFTCCTLHTIHCILFGKWNVFLTDLQSIYCIFLIIKRFNF